MREIDLPIVFVSGLHSSQARKRQVKFQAQLTPGVISVYNFRNEIQLWDFFHKHPFRERSGKEALFTLTRVESPEPADTLSSFSNTPSTKTWLLAQQPVITQGSPSQLARSPGLIIK
jgi:hypothetical protein